MSSQDNQIQRLRYFDNQFLNAEDFTTEQKYHREMRLRHNRLLHTKGVAEGLQVKKTATEEITVTPGTAIDGDGNEIVLLGNFTIKLTDKTKYRENSTVYVFASYKEKKAEPQPDDSTDENQTTRIFEKAVIKAETEEPDANDKHIVRLGRFKLDADGNVPDESKFSNEGFREESTAKLPEFSISIKQLKTIKVADSKISNLKGFGESEIEIDIDKSYKRVDKSYVSSTTKNVGVFLLVYAHATKAGSKFEWSQRYETVEEGQDVKLKQFVVFKNMRDEEIEELKYIIYAVLEE